MILLYIVVSVATLVSASTSSEWPIHPGVGAIYKGPDSEIIVEGPDGSIIKSLQEGGSVATKAETVEIVPIVVKEEAAPVPVEVEIDVAIPEPEPEEASVELNGPSGTIATKGSKAIIAGPASTTYTGPEVGGKVVDLPRVNPPPIFAKTPETGTPLAAKVAVDGLTGNREIAPQIISSTFSPINNLPITNAFINPNLPLISEETLPLQSVSLSSSNIESSTIAPELLNFPQNPQAFPTNSYVPPKLILEPPLLSGLQISSTLSPPVEDDVKNIGFGSSISPPVLQFNSKEENLRPLVPYPQRNLVLSSTLPPLEVTATNTLLQGEKIAPVINYPQIQNFPPQISDTLSPPALVKETNFAQFAENSQFNQQNFVPGTLNRQIPPELLKTLPPITSKVPQVANISPGSIPLSVTPNTLFRQFSPSSAGNIPNIQNSGAQTFPNDNPQTVVKEVNPENLAESEIFVQQQQGFRGPITNVRNYVEYSHVDLPNTLYRGLALKKF